MGSPTWNTNWNTTSVPTGTTSRAWSWNTAPPPSQGYSTRFSNYSGGDRNQAYTWSPTETKSERLKQGFMKSVQRAGEGGSFGGPIGAAIGGGLGLIEGIWGGGPKPISPAEQWATNVGIEGNEAFKTYAPWVREQGMQSMSNYSNAVGDQWAKFLAGQGTAQSIGGQGAAALQGWLGRAEAMQPTEAREALQRNLQNQGNVNTTANNLYLAQMQASDKNRQQLMANPMLSQYEKAKLGGMEQRGTQAQAASIAEQELGKLREFETQYTGQITNFLATKLQAITSGYSTLAQVQADIANLSLQEQRMLLDHIGRLPNEWREQFKSLLPPEMQYQAAQAGGAMQAQNQAQQDQFMQQLMKLGYDIYKSRGKGGGGSPSGDASGEG